MATNNDDNLKRLADATEDIRRLFIFTILRGGASQADVAEALGVNQSSISRLFANKSAGARARK
jgi:predicted XRE-type DNA-binding protein